MNLALPGQSTRTGTALQLAALLGTWLALRVVFFEGLWGYDDLDHIAFAMHPGPPRDVFQARLLLNGMLIAAYHAFGAAEWAWALPTLLGSLVFVLATWWTARRLFPERPALLAAFLAATMVLDVTLSTDPGGSPLANGFAAVGTALLLTGDSRRRLVWAGLALTGGMLAHLATALYVAPLLVAWALHDRPRRRWREALLLFGVIAAAWLAVDCTLFTLVKGDPFGHYRLLVSTHLAHQPYHDVPPRLPDGRLNPAFFTWSLRGLVFTKHFGFLLSLPLAAGIALWRRWDRVGRLLVLLVGLGWLYLNFGSQHPLAWAPLGKTERYWYPLALPACLLAVRVLRELRGAWARRAWLAALWAPVPLALVSAGPWGQNVEISRELAAYATRHPDRTFVTDPYTYDEMFLDGGRHAPANVTVFADGGPDIRDDQPPPLAKRLPLAPGDFEALVNVMNLDRLRAQPFEAFVRARMVRAEAAPPTWRLIAALLPESVRAAHPFLMRRPAAEVARFAP